MEKKIDQLRILDIKCRTFYGSSFPFYDSEKFGGVFKPVEKVIFGSVCDGYVFIFHFLRYAVVKYQDLPRSYF